MNYFKMKISFMYLVLGLCVNFLATIVVAYYKKCYDEFSICLIANTANPYYDNKFTLTQSSAEEWCRANSSSLVIITNETVQSAIVKFINDPVAKLSWDVITYGSRLNLDNWKWINGQQSAIYPDSRFYNNDYRYAFLVVSAYTTYVSYDWQASSKRKFICSYHLNQNYRCPDGYHRFGSSCNKVHDEAVSWFDARSICLNEEGIDLATFENGTKSLLSEWIGQYWIGLRKESWHWIYDQTFVDIKHSNWEDGYPRSTGGDCLCLKAGAGTWKNCYCSGKYRYVCIQDYTSDSASSVSSSTRKITTAASKVNITIPEMTNTPTTITMTSTVASKKPNMTTSAAKITTRTTKVTTRTVRTSTKTTRPKITQSMTSTIPTAGDSSSLSQFHSTLTHSLDDNSRTNGSENSPIGFGSEQNSGFLPIIIGVGIACLLILIVAIVVVVFIKNRRSLPSGHEPTNGNSKPPMTYNDDAPNTVYAAVIPNTNDPVYSASEQNSNQTVYAELDLDPRWNISPTQRISGKVIFKSEEIPSQAVYAEVNCLPKENTNGRPEGPSEYDNYSQLMTDSVYANSAQTRV